MHSHHSHSGEFCRHAKSTLDEVTERAASLGFTHFHLSEHIPRELPEQLYPEEEEAGLTPAQLEATFRAYLAKARALQTRYAQQDPPMHILVGCETENITSPQSLDFLCKVVNPDGASLGHLPPPCIGLGVVDYMVGSVHHAHGIPIDFDADTFHKAVAHGGAQDAAGYASLLHAYLDAQLEVLDRLRPEVVGHFDLYRLFAPNAPWMSGDAGDALRGKVERNIRFAASYGALFEANSSAFRKGWDGETYPGREILRMIRSVHGRIALSDDSHGVQQVGLNYHRLHDYLEHEGVDEIWYLERDPSPRSSDPAKLWDEFRESEAVREQNASRDDVGAHAPRTFPRGTRAHVLRDWRAAPFWRSAGPPLHS